VGALAAGCGRLTKKADDLEDEGGERPFVPQRLMEIPAFFGRQERVKWILAEDVAGAALLARAMEQHELALLIHLRQKADRTYIPDLAVQLGQKHKTADSRGHCNGLVSRQRFVATTKGEP
jgi:hypothetical protein